MNFATEEVERIARGLTKAQRATFKREERFIVVKRKHLHPTDEDALRKLLEVRNIPTVECVVVESDWPEYETVWQMIEARCTGQAERTITSANPAGLEAEPGEVAQLVHVIETRLLGIDPDSQDVVLEDKDWRIILAALSALDGGKGKS